MIRFDEEMIIIGGCVFGGAMLGGAFAGYIGAGIGVVFGIVVAVGALATARSR